MKFSDDQMEQLENLLEIKLEEKISPVRKDIRKIKSDVKTVIEYFDEENLSLRERVKRIEDHLHLSHIS